MNTILSSPAHSDTAAQPALATTHELPRSRSGAALVFAHFAFFAIALGVLSSAIGWPDVLREPPAVVFARIGAAMTATKLGYASYLLSSLLMVPLAFLMRELFNRSGSTGWWVDALAFTGAAAGVLKAMGIVRWLLAMPLLAEQHAAAASASARQTLEAVFMGVNAYGGSLGEVLGVQLFSGMWFAGVSLILWRQHGQRFVGGFGLLVAVLTLLLATRPFVPDIGALEIVGGPLWLAWLLSLAVMLGRARG